MQNCIPRYELLCVKCFLHYKIEFRISRKISWPPYSERGRKRKSREGGGSAERTVRILCGRLSSEREYEEVEIELPLSVYKNMQAMEGEGEQAAGQRSHHGLLKKVCGIFARRGRQD